MQHSYIESPTARQSGANWDFYFCEVDENAALISVDLNLAEFAPNVQLPYVVYISLKINNKSAKGFPAPSELGTLCRIEDHLLARIGRQNTALFCGRVTTNGCRDLIFFAQNPTRTIALLEAGMRQFPQYKFEAGWKEDPDWDMYFNFLFPNENELNAIFNQRVVAQLRKSGTPLTEKRHLVHTAYFQNETDRDRFILRAIDDFFRVESVSRDDSKTTNRWVVRIGRPDYVDIARINSLTSELLEATRACNGVYDGWK